MVLRLPIMPKSLLMPVLMALTLFFTPHAGALEWALNKEQSRITFEMVSADGSLTCSFGQFEAEIRFDPDFLDLTEIRVVIDINTVSTGNPALDDELRSPPWFDTQTYPAAGFRATSLVRGASGNSYTLNGNLTIRGISHPVSFPVTIDIEQGDARMIGETAIDRQAFGIGADASLGGANAPGDLVIIRLDIVATRLDN